jgi:hypothetical protein
VDRSLLKRYKRGEILKKITLKAILPAALVILAISANSAFARNGKQPTTNGEQRLIPAALDINAGLSPPNGVTEFSNLSLWRSSTGQWFVQRSENNSYYSVPFGRTGDLPALGDYDGDGRFDTAVFRQTTGSIFLKRET